MGPTTYNMPPTTSPTCVGIIMDGNRRWAREHGLPSLEGHRRGYEKLKEVMGWCREAGIAHLAVYAFSTENWKRSADEVGYLMDLMRTMLREQLPELRKEHTAVHVVGKLDLLPADLQETVSTLHDTNPRDAIHHLWACISYGGRAAIADAVNILHAEGVGEVNEDAITRTLWTADMPAPDIILRTGGEKRLSNFLMWHSGYSELFFLDTYWPDFSRVEFDEVLTQFTDRKRNYGI